MYVVVHEMNSVFFMISSFDGHHSGIGNIEPRVIFDGLMHTCTVCTYTAPQYCTNGCHGGSESLLQYVE